jgi:hypothetical protein
VAKTQIASQDLRTDAIVHPKFRVYKTASQQGDNDDDWVKLTSFSTTYDSTCLDSHGYFSDDRYTPLLAGMYLFTASMGANKSPLTANIRGSFEVAQARVYADPSYACANISGMIYMNGSTDYVELWGYVSPNPSPGSILLGTTFQGCRVSA